MIKPSLMSPNHFYKYAVNAFELQIARMNLKVVLMHDAHDGAWWWRKRPVSIDDDAPTRWVSTPPTRYRNLVGIVQSADGTL
jgi:hypothetical protein